MQKKLIVTLCLLLYFILYTSYSIQAAPPSPATSPLASPKPSIVASPSPMPVSIDEVTENLKKRLVESLDAETTPAKSPRAYIGMVKDVIKNTIVISDKDGKKDIKLEDDATILRSPGSASIQADDIRIDDYIIAMGYPEGEDVLTGRRLIVSTNPIKTPAKSSGLGTIVKSSKTSLTLKVDSAERVLAITSKTQFKSAGGTIEFVDLAVGDTLIYTATVDEDDDLTATIFMRVATAALAE